MRISEEDPAFDHQGRTQFVMKTDLLFIVMSRKFYKVAKTQNKTCILTVPTLHFHVIIILGRVKGGSGTF